MSTRRVTRNSGKLLQVKDSSVPGDSISPKAKQPKRESTKETHVIPEKKKPLLLSLRQNNTNAAVAEKTATSRRTTRSTPHTAANKENVDNKNDGDDSSLAVASSSGVTPKAKKPRKAAAQKTKDVGPIRGADADYSSLKLTKICPAKRKATVDKLLEQMRAGLSTSSKGDCVKEAIRRGFLNIAGTADDLNKLVFKDVNITDYGDCDCLVDVTLQMLLEQPNYVGCCDTIDTATIICKQHQETGRNVLTGMCDGNVEVESSGSGKYLNHCTEGKCSEGKFGKCIGDYREAHCEHCHGHYFGGAIDYYPCPCGGESVSEDESADEVDIMTAANVAATNCIQQ